MNQIVFELNDGAFWLSIGVGVFSIIILYGIFKLGREIYSKTIFDYFKVIEAKLVDHGFRGEATPSELKALIDFYAEHFERRNEFWTIYGQVVIAIFIALILAILLITKTISAEAGLPILSAISGFAIAKGSNAGKTSTGFSPNDKSDN